MAAALECWSGRPSTDEDLVEQVLMSNPHRSEFSPPPLPPSSPPRKWQLFARTLTQTLSSLRTTLTPNSTNPSTLFGPHLSESLLSDLRRHFDSLPNSYSNAGFEMSDVMLHMRLVERAVLEGQVAVHIEKVKEEKEEEGLGNGVVLKISFVCNSVVSWAAMSCELDGFVVSCNCAQMFEKKGLTLGVVVVMVVVSEQFNGEKQFKGRIETAIKSAMKKPRSIGGVKLPFGLCGRQEEKSTKLEEDNGLPSTLPECPIKVEVDEWQIIQSSSGEIARWILNPKDVEFVDQTGPNSFKGVHKGKKIWIKRVRGCERGSSYEFEIRQDLLQLMTCGHRNILQFVGIVIDESNGLCVVTRMMEGGSIQDLIHRRKRIGVKEVMKITLDLAEGLMFMNNHGVAYRDLNVQRVLLDRQGNGLLDRLGNGLLGDMGVVTCCSNNGGEVTEYETAGYRWLAPEIIAGDPESVTETWMSNVYSFGLVVWEMVTGESAYSSYSPVQAAVGIAACGLRPEIPKDCPQVLRSLMMKCWNNCPPKRPQFSDIIALLQKQKQ